MSIDRIWPVMAGLDKVLSRAFKIMDSYIALSCNGDPTPEIQDTLADEGYYQACYGMAAGNRSLHTAHGGETHTNAIGVLTDSCVQMNWHTYRWRKTGSTVYDLDAGLGAAFLDTELRVTGDDVNLPLPTFYLAVPRELGLRVWNQASGWHDLDGFFISESHTFKDVEAGEDGIMHLKRKVVLGGVETELTINYESWFKRVAHVLAIGMPHAGRAIDDNALSSFPLPLSTADFETYVDGLDKDPRYAKGMAKNVPELRRWHRLIVNTALYMSNPDANSVQKQRLGPSPELKRRARGGKKSDQRALEAATLPVTYFKVGAGFSVDAGVRARSLADDETRELTKRFMVRGHWRRQAHGAGRKERRLQWVKPFWKGPEWAEVARAHVVKIKEEEQNET